MKRILAGVAAVVLLIVVGGVAHAEEGGGVEAGFKMWVNDWTHDVPGAGSISSDTTVLFGPALQVTFPNRVFIDATYLFSLSNYSFPGDANFNDSRQDAEVKAGYMIIPGFGVLAGYKNSLFKEKETGITDTVYGPLIGMVATAPVYYNTSFYGKLDYLFTRFKQRGGGIDGFREDSPGWMMEFGVKVDFTRTFAGSFGYKYETNTGNTSDVQDSFSGLIFSGMFAF